MEEYYLNTIENGNKEDMYNLGYYYQNEKKYDKMKKYYLMAIKNKNYHAMVNLGYYYENIKKNMIL